MLGENILHVGKYRGQTFRWCLENAVGYSAWLVASSISEKSESSPLMLNKASFRKYATSFPEMQVEVANKVDDKKKQPVGFFCKCIYNVSSYIHVYGGGGSMII